MANEIRLLIKECEEILEVKFNAEHFNNIEKYYNFLSEWNKKINLISRKSELPVLKNALLEAYSLYEVLQYEEGVFLDVGTGGGLPGMLIACLMPDVKIDLLDSTRKKTVFVQLAIDELKFENVSVINGRLEELSKKDYDDKYDIVFTRGVGKFKVITPHLLRVLNETGSVYILTGEDNGEFFKNYKIFENPYLETRIIVHLEK
ncbi:MAG: 16S rRNA (guanine(527)-N(7))-methyltransferase RsmG [Candidatus Delongbacteria bacterium]|jgi:16S rRNA (guanine527-N7)-methyltransferase|nr:16S rRNA (guanine(527)-N(7))-methyltransferase RsmG [Candidatus Delongbacteria bacterium]